MVNRIGLVLAAIAGLTGWAAASPLDLKEVPADVTWVVHLDGAVLRSSVVAQKAFQKQLATDKDAPKKLDELRALTGVDLAKDVHGATLYGKKLGKNEVVLVIHADVDQKMLELRLPYAQQYKAISHRTFQIHSWIDEKGSRIFGAFAGPKTILLAPTEDEAKAALDVLEGKSPSLAGGQSALSAEAPAGTAIVARAIGLGESDLPFKSPLVTQSEAFGLAVGERGGEAFAEARIGMKTVEVARQVKSIIEGARALAEVQQSTDPGMVKLLEKLQVRVTEKTVHCDARAPAKEVWEQLEKVWNAALADAGKKPEPSAGAQK